MPSRQLVISTTDFDLAACYLMFTGRQPVLFRQPGDNLTTVEMTDTEDTRRLMLEYSGWTGQVGGWDSERRKMDSQSGY